MIDDQFDAAVKELPYPNQDETYSQQLVQGTSVKVS